VPEFPDSGSIPIESAPEPPEWLQGHESVWNGAIAANLAGADRNEFADAHYFGYVQRDGEGAHDDYEGMTPAERKEWRLIADDMREDLDVDLDWDAWRDEMGYND
jgi:hypothetical protein